MQLIETIDGTFVNADFVARWEPIPPLERKPGAPPPGGAWALFDYNDKRLGATDTEPDAASFAWPVVAAYPGFRVLVIVPGDEPSIEEHHVIAWRIPPVGDFPMPVTLSDVPDSNCVIQSPTDHIVAQGGGEFANRDALMAAYQDAKAREEVR